MHHPALQKKVRDHYEARAFSPRLVDDLCAEIAGRTQPEGIEIAKGWRIPVQNLLEIFEPVDQKPRPAVLLPAPAAILTFSFGYRLESPFGRRPNERSPGPNNRALAEMTARCHELFPDAWIAAQHETAIALSDIDGPTPSLISPARDWNTDQVLGYFVEHLPRYAFGDQRSVLVVSHLHHYGRCEALLARAGLEAYPAPKEVSAYADYDPAEAQPRFRSPWDYLVNDFLALCKSAARTQPVHERHGMAGVAATVERSFRATTAQEGDRAQRA